MFIKSMVLEGFKSYGKRIEITGFDKEFNAITGFNGSGKSNILDAICFVLGITNLGQVRATSLQELVYKSGQAGIQKATVTIVFDNRDRDSSPMGYEHHEELVITRQIIIGGKNKYLINGSNVPNKRVQDLFCSVQLNVNNPHFLIMQGRITKVLNMKPGEILSMIEEAAGTRMYETKKQTALKTIEKKDNRLKEINDVLQEEIAPKLNKLKLERSQYMEFQRMQRELEHYKRINIAWKYTIALKHNEKAEKDIRLTKDTINEKLGNINIGEEEIREIDDKLAEIVRTRDAEFGMKLEKLEHDLKDAEKVQYKVAARSNGNKEDIKAARKTEEQLRMNIVEDEEMLLVKEKEIEKFGSLFQQLKEEDERDAEALIVAQERYQKISSGLLQTEDGENATLEQQLICAKQGVTQAQTELKQSQMSLDHAKSQLNGKLKDMYNTEDEYMRDNKDLERKEKELKNLENELKKINYKKGHLEELQAQKHSLKCEIRSLQEKVDQFELQYPQLRFHYKIPDGNFKENSVKGLACTLLTIKNKDTAYALDVAASGKLYNVIVDTENTSKRLLQQGQLQQRVTIIPLNKINGRAMERHIIEFAERLVGPDNVQSALSLIDFPEELRPAMTWIFGQTFICKDMETAKRIAFHEKIMKKCVTIEGDIFDPAGTLSGGAPSKTGSVLLKIEELKETKNSLKEKQQHLTEIERVLTIAQKAEGQYASLKERFDLHKYEVDMVRQRLQQTTHHKIKEEVESLKANIDGLMKRMNEAKILERDNERRTKELECQLKDAINIREKQLKESECLLTTLKRKAEKSRAEWQKREQESETLELEIKELKGTIESGKGQLIKAEEKLIELNEIARDYEKELEEINVTLEDLRKNVKEQKRIINQQNEDVQKLNAKREDIVKQNGETELEIKKLNHEINTFGNYSKDCKEKVVELTKRYQWIEEDKQYFGKAGGMYDFEVNKPEEMEQKLQQLQIQCDKLSRNVNTRAINLLDKEEEQYNDMVKKKKIVESDKKKILETIKYLDEKKKETLLKAWEQVNRDFGSIFNSLLPGADAKLIPPENQTVTEGLEIKIGFSGVWKESLGELSGGQRSLVALSLILAMLLFKPAPLYILDEVDAALDLSHTENIGTMLKRHFKHSQFIVVSLKDGMFNNANVLFTTRFIDGMSTVTRTEKSRSK
ncbi:structural maintenance of chromosomes protein 2 isoform X1 [Vespa velutina]|uniref:structural maintenance of chromosomes protein 2 isoform X1 n=2 Tax=Vespa velutina TaxID=202808 RepID=UPI001FB26BE8|nr:structural maintenance of chromosomes protein 2 isoform X1 [Vespa velutina]